MTKTKTKKRMRPEEEDGSSNKPSRVDLNVSGTHFAVNTSTIMQFPDTMLGAMLSERWRKENTKADEEIFLDRDPILFRYILGFYRNAKLVIPHTITKAEMYSEIEYFALPLQEEEIQYDTSSIASMKNGIVEIENRYVETLMTTARDCAMVAGANELAVMLIDKIRGAPNSGWVCLEYGEVPLKSVAKIMFYEHLDDELLQLIQSIVGKAGYTLGKGGDRLTLSRNVTPPQICTDRWD